MLVLTTIILLLESQEITAIKPLLIEKELVLLLQNNVAIQSLQRGPIMKVLAGHVAHPPPAAICLRYFRLILFV